MEIIDLRSDYEGTYFNCLEDWSEEMKESGTLKSEWYEKVKKKGLRVKLAKEENGSIVGMIQYIPIEESYVEGEKLYFIYCIWVHSYKKGVGDYSGKGIGSKLLEAAEDDAKSLGAKGICAWGVKIPVFMRSKWFKKKGYVVADKDGLAELVWKPFFDDAIAPKWIKQKKKPERVDGKVVITAFKNGWCPAQNMSYERARLLAEEYGDDVQFKSIDGTDKKVLDEWGIHDGIFIDDKLITKGPPLKKEKIRRAIDKKLKKVR